MQSGRSAPASMIPLFVMSSKHLDWLSRIFFAAQALPLSATREYETPLYRYSTGVTILPFRTPLAANARLLVGFAKEIKRIQSERLANKTLALDAVLNCCNHNNDDEKDIPRTGKATAHKA